MPEPADHEQLVVVDTLAAQPALELADAVTQVVRVGFGLVSVALAELIRAVEQAPRLPPERGPQVPADSVADLVVGTAWSAARLSGRLATTGTKVAAPIIGSVLRPPLVPTILQPGHMLQLVVERWQRDRPETVRTLSHWSMTVLPGAMEATLRQVDVEQVLSVVLDRIDIDALVTDLLRRIDPEALVIAVLGRIDLTRVAAGVDLDSLMATVLQRLDLEALMKASLHQVDLTATVIEQVDLGRVVEAAMQQLDLTKIVLQEVDLIGVAEYVVAGIDLPELIRGSTGSMASEAVRDVRLQGVDADAAVARVVDRLLRRRKRDTAVAPGSAEAGDSRSGAASKWTP
jgi:hypothetical protein